MQQATELKKQLQSIHRKVIPPTNLWKAVTSLGIISFPSIMYREILLHLPHTSVSIFPAKMPVSGCLQQNSLTCITLADHLTRQFEQQINHYSFRAKGSGKSGLISVSHCGQEILSRTACEITSEASLPDFLLVFLQMAVPLMHPNWKRFCSIFFLPV